MLIFLALARVDKAKFILAPTKMALAKTLLCKADPVLDLAPDRDRNTRRSQAEGASS